MHMADTVTQFTEANAAGITSDRSSTAASDEENSASIEEKADITEEKPAGLVSENKESTEPVNLHPIEGAWAEPKNLWIIMR